MDVILSIKPKYVDAIIRGIKKYEFRKFCFKSRNIDNIYIYSTSPVKKIVGLFVTHNIVRDSPQNLWINYKEVSGVGEIEFFNYFKNSEMGYAIEINDLKEFESPVDPRKIIPRFMAPLSFCYIDGRLMKDQKLFNQLRNNYCEDHLNGSICQSTISDYAKFETILKSNRDFMDEK